MRPRGGSLPPRRSWGAGLCLLLLLTGASSGAAAADPPPKPGRTLLEHFLEGNELYHQERFAEAVEAYRRVTRYGVRDADLEHNLGNALLRAGKPGEAVLHYERALRLDPRARDTRHNLELAEKGLADGATLQLVHKGIQVGEGSEASWVGFFRILTRTEAAILLLVLELLAGLAWLGRRLAKPTSTERTLLGWAAGVLLVFTLAWGAYVGGQGYVERYVRLGVVLEPLPVREGPSPEAQILFKAPAGLKVRVEESPLSGWRSLRVNDDLRGFAPAAQVVPIEPF
ncbi:MAG: tetratricopeptide repeat protein [Myxococcota bacterium]|jgi:tetratricopeptide (TPR) repeat protein|nr:tetratricopeptide repeat protein [Myxococcota bacterium]